MKEIWKPVPGNGDYEVSSRGNIRSLHRSKIRKLKVHNAGRALQYHIWNRKASSYTTLTASRLVAKMFIRYPRPTERVTYRDGDFTNIAASNLVILTRAEWVARCSQHSPSGQQHASAKLTDSDVRKIRKLRADGHKLKAIGNRFGVHESTVSCICSGKRWVGAS